MTTERTLFDLRDHPDDGLVLGANKLVAAVRPEYFERYGAIGSASWWRHYNAGRISRSIHVGMIVHLGPETNDFGEADDIVRIRTDR